MKTLSGYLMIVVAVVAVWLEVLPDSAARIITSWINMEQEN
jgi:hypothetical protein